MRKISDMGYDRLVDETCAQMEKYDMTAEEALNEMRDLYYLTEEEFDELCERFSEEMDYDDDDYADEPADDDWDAYVMDNAHGPDYEPDFYDGE